MAIGGAAAEWDFYVTYSELDRPWAVWIAWTLEASGFRVLVADWDMVAGTNHALLMDEGLRHSRHVLAVVSDAAVGGRGARTPPSTPGVPMESLVAAVRDASGTGRGVVPVVVTEVTLTCLLAALTVVDLAVAQSEEQAREGLLAGVKGSPAPIGEPDADRRYRVSVRSRSRRPLTES